MYKPKLFSTPMVLHIPEYSTVLGIRQKTYTPSAELNPFYGSFVSYGGTEHDINGVVAVDDTAIVETWFHPSFKPNCAISLKGDENLYEIISNPENIEERRQYCRFKVRIIKGGA